MFSESLPPRAQGVHQSNCSAVRLAGRPMGYARTPSFFTGKRPPWKVTRIPEEAGSSSNINPWNMMLLKVVWKIDVWKKKWFPFWNGSSSSRGRVKNQHPPTPDEGNPEGNLTFNDARAEALIHQLSASLFATLQVLSFTLASWRHP